MGIDRTSEARVILPGVLTIGITFRIVNVFRRQITTESLGSHLEFFGNISMGQESAERVQRLSLI